MSYISNIIRKCLTTNFPYCTSAISEFYVKLSVNKKIRIKLLQLKKLLKFNLNQLITN